MRTISLFLSWALFEILTTLQQLTVMIQVHPSGLTTSTVGQLNSNALSLASRCCITASSINRIYYLFQPVVPYRLIIGILNLLPSSFCKFLSIVDTHDAQVMPVICKKHFSAVAVLGWFVPSRWGPSGRASKAQPWRGGSGAWGCTAALLASGRCLCSPEAVSWINAQ